MPTPKRRLHIIYRFLPIELFINDIIKYVKKSPPRKSLSPNPQIWYHQLENPSVSLKYDVIYEHLHMATHTVFLPFLHTICNELKSRDIYRHSRIHWENLPRLNCKLYAAARARHGHAGASNFSIKFSTVQYLQCWHQIRKYKRKYGWRARCKWMNINNMHIIMQNRFAIGEQCVWTVWIVHWKMLLCCFIYWSQMNGYPNSCLCIWINRVWFFGCFHFSIGIFSISIPGIAHKWRHHCGSEWLDMCQTMTL